LASLPPGKEEIRFFLKYLILQLHKLGVKVILNRELTAADVAKVEADALILASGGIPQKPVTPGVDQENVLTAWEALLAPERVGKKVLVVGAGAVGAETADFLADRTREVSLIEMAQEIALDEERTNRKLLLRRLGEKRVKIRVMTQARAILPEGVEVESDGWREILPADTVVLATGVRPNRDLWRNSGGREARFVPPIGRRSAPPCLVLANWGEFKSENEK
jgi:pyruvate/2-oxoglutarate dehydrogenase complex dihydrolipoamide dehydrogenase (E3) component